MSEQFRRRLIPLGIVAMALLVSLIFVQRTVIPNLPNDPLLPRMSLQVKQMFWNAVFKDSVEFLRQNNVTGRTLTTAPLGDFLKFHLPAVKLYMDGRAQTIYSLETLHEYKTLLDTEPANDDSMRRAISILKGLDIKWVVLPSNSELDGLKESVLASKDWVGVYTDEYAMVFVPKTESMSNLKYPNHRAQAGGNALQSLTSGSGLSSAQMLDLAKLSQEAPASWIYNLMAQGAVNRSGCIAPNTKKYFANEISRLSKMNYMRSNGANEILKTVVDLSGILEQEQKLCPSSEPIANWTEIADRYAGLYSRLSQEYMPH